MTPFAGVSVTNQPGHEGMLACLINWKPDMI
jgi:hypothetical protein